MRAEPDKNNCGERKATSNHASNANDRHDENIYEHPRESNSSAQNEIADGEEEDGDGSTQDGSGDSERHLRSSSQSLTHSHDSEERTAIQRVVSTMFGQARREASEEEKTRHLGVVWKNLTVKGVGLGATLQPTCGDIFLGIPRLLGRLFTGKVRRKQPVRNILDEFSVGFICPISAFLFRVN